MGRHSVQHDRLRHVLAREAARLMIEHGHEDFGLAKRKAAERLGVTDQAVLPRNTEIEAALSEHQRLFGASTHPDELLSLRRAALQAMQLLHQFEPRLVGPVLSGTATAHSDIELHLFAETAEAVVMVLLDAGIRHQMVERRIKLQREEAALMPVIRLVADGHEVAAMVFPTDGIRQSPFSPVDGRPMRRASRTEVLALVEGDSGD